MRFLHWTGRSWIAWPVAAAWLAAGLWRLLLGAQERNSEFGLSQHEHRELLAIQGVLGVLAGLAFLAVAMSVREGERRTALAAAALLVVLAAGYAAIFLRPGLLAWGGVEN